MMTIQQQYEVKFLPLILESMIEFYVNDSGEQYQHITSLTDFNMINTFLQANIEIEKRIVSLVNPDRYLKCMYEFLTYEGTATYPQLYSWFRKYYLKEDEESVTERRMREKFRDNFTIMEVFGLIKHQVVTGQKGTQNLYVAPFCSEEQYNKATTKFKKYADYIELNNKVFYDRKPEKETKPDIIETLITCGAFSVNCTEKIPVSQKYCAEHIKVFA